MEARQLISILTLNRAFEKRAKGSEIVFAEFLFFILFSANFFGFVALFRHGFGLFFIFYDVKLTAAAFFLLIPKKS